MNISKTLMGEEEFTITRTPGCGIAGTGLRL